MFQRLFPGRIKFLISLFISLMPLNFLRILLYRFINGYQISLAAKIGFGTIIMVDKAIIGRVSIGKRNRFQGPSSLQIKDGARIGSFNAFLTVDEAKIGCASIGQHNLFQGPFSLQIKDGARIVAHNTFHSGSWVLKAKFQDAGYQRSCVIKRDSLITNGHFIDTIGGFELGERSWLAGRDSQFWTHGAKVMDRSILIGSDCYISSAVRFSPGSHIGNHSIVGLGSVVTKKFNRHYLLIGGVPAKIIKENYDWKKHSTLEAPDNE